MSRALRYAAACLPLVLLGCDAETAKQEGDKRSGLGAAEKADWLDVRNATSPAAWLLARRDVREEAPTADAVSQALAMASERFGESPRMIANRAVQIETMLRQIGAEESAVSLISELATAVGSAGKSPGFGSVGQFYYNLRKSGLSKQQALGDLSKRYGDNG